MTKKEIAKICNVDERTIEINSKKVGIKLGDRWHPHDFTEDELKKIQAQLMMNSNNQGNGSQIVKESAKAAFAVGISLQELIKSGNVAAIDEYFGIVRNATAAQHDLQIEQARNHQLQLENKQLVEENDYLKKANEFTTAQLGYYKRKYHSYYDDYEIY